MSVAMSDDGNALVALLPHRPPFLFVDGVDACEPAVTVRAHYRVTGTEPFLAGHFPGNPIFPGVLQLEALAKPARSPGPRPPGMQASSRCSAAPRKSPSAPAGDPGTGC